jgi:hypothetical protein
MNVEEMRTQLRDIAAETKVPHAERMTGVRRRVRRARRRRAAAGAVALAALGALALPIAADRISDSLLPATQAPEPQVTISAAMPNLVGLTSDEVWSRLHPIGLRNAQHRFIASNDAPAANTIVAQEPLPGEPAPRVGLQLTLTYSAGGPAVSLQEVPQEAADLLRRSLLPGELVLVVPTAAGTAYKTDALLVGPCEAVALAYRTFQDPQYGDRCY